MPLSLAQKMLRANATFSAFSALSLILAPQFVAGLLFVSSAPWHRPLMIAVGAGLLCFAVLLAALSKNPSATNKWIHLIIWADLGWVFGSFSLILGLPFLFSQIGFGLVIAIAVIVSLFAFGQYRGATLNAEQTMPDGVSQTKH